MMTSTMTFWINTKPSGTPVTSAFLCPEYGGGDGAEDAGPALGDDDLPDDVDDETKELLRQKREIQRQLGLLDGMHPSTTFDLMSR